MLKNEKIIIYLFYVICCTLSTGYYIYMKHIYGDLRGYYLSSSTALIISYIIAILGISLFCLLTSTLIKSINIRTAPEIKVKHFHMLIFCLNISFISFSIKYNFGFSGVEADSDIPKTILYFFILLQPQFISYIYFCCYIRSSNKIYYLNMIIILLFSIYKGWLGTIVFLSLILFMKNKEFIVKNKKKFFSLGLLFIFIVPFLKAAKTILMNYHQLGFDSLSDAVVNFIEHNEFKDLSDFITTYAMATVNRFEHVSIIYYVYEIISPNMLGNIRPAILEGWPNEIIGNALGFNYISYVQQELARMIEPMYAWQVHIPITARVFIEDNLLIYFIYILLIIIISVLLTKIISNKHELQTLNWFVLFSFLFHGWNYSMILWLQALFIYILIMFILTGLSRIKKTI